MYFPLGKSIIVAGLLVGAFPSVASAQFLVSCAPGMAAQQSTDGVEIVGGVIQLLGEVCRPSGGTLPDAMIVQNQNVLPNPVNAAPGVTVSYMATLQNLITQPVAGVTYDQCSVTLRDPGNQLISTTPIANLTASVAVAVPIPSNAAAGTWRLALSCRRYVGGQEVILPTPDPSSITLTVNSNVPPSACTEMEAPFVSRLSGTYQSAYSLPFGTPHTWLDGVTGNTFVNNQLTEVGVRSFTFNGPVAGINGTVRLPSVPNGIVFSISKECGNFKTVPDVCRIMHSGQLLWSTNANAGPSYCKLTPGEPYYLNAAWFSLPHYLQNGSVVSTAPCDGANCTSNKGFHHMVSIP